MIILDTNVVFEYKKLKLFFFKSEIAITKPCLEEINRLAKKKKFPIELINDVKVINTEKMEGDDSIIEAAKKYKCKVATFDKILSKRLKENNIFVLESDKEIISELGK
ncbi:MAG: hypothetical protein B6U88_00100 [Candidatus Aenigmarchaeota archaeon ex4484_56]|nr:MAG: hypothetical protein B6U88_00100 [Candidatus Aenigmarchaeota archaeon ex4484_56]